MDNLISIPRRRNFMRSALRLAVFVALLASSIVATAQYTPECQIYTFSDQWVDDDNNAVVLNATDSQSSCGGYSTYSAVDITMPSGYYQSASEVGTWGSSQAVALAPIPGEEGTGLMTGYNQISYDCGLDLGASFSLPFVPALAVSKFKLTGIDPTGCRTLLGPNQKEICDWAVQSWCTPETTPPLFDTDAITDLKVPPPLGFWDGGAACIKVFGTWHCSHGFFAQSLDGTRKTCTVP